MRGGAQRPEGHRDTPPRAQPAVCHKTTRMIAVMRGSEFDELRLFEAIQNSRGRAPNRVNRKSDGPGK